MPTWHAANTHLYPGARLTAATRSPARAGPLLIEFADLGSAAAHLVGRPGAWRLQVEAHRTKRGTAIAARAWHIEPLPVADAPGTWRVLRRAD